MKKAFLGLLFVPAMSVLGACDHAHDPDRAAVADAAAESGFRLAGTCGPSYEDNSCGDQSGGYGSCWCDSLCTTFGDCCGDYQDFCDGDDPVSPEPNLQGEGETCLGIAALQCEPGLVCGDVQVGVSDPAGVCMRPCGTIAGLVCNAGEYCDYDQCPSEVSDAGGVCRPIGSPVCTEQYQPVCGCDSVTYSNDCFAAAAGASIAFEGECPPVECSSEDDCTDSFCGWADDNVTRICKPWGQVGDSCLGFVLPSARTFCEPGLVCDQSGTGDPTGDAPGVCVEEAGEPDNAGEGEFCGGIAANLPQNQCEAGLTCVGVFGGCAPGVADAGGTCIDVDPGAACTAEYAPVCGCDGVTYSNGCVANMQNGVGILANGPCASDEPGPDSCIEHCGGTSDDGSCWCDEWCSYYGDCCDDVAAACG